MFDIGRTLMVMGAILFVVGVIVTFLAKVPGIGKLPGDILIERKNFTFYFPIATSILISLVLSLFLWFFNRR